MQPIPYTQEALDLLHNGSLALAEVESAGMAVDVPYIQKAIGETKQKVKVIEDGLESHDVMKKWRKYYRGKTNINSVQQLSHVLFAVMRFPEPKKKTTGGEDAADEETLLDIDDPQAGIFVKKYLLAKKLKKAASTNLKGILREAVDGMLHVFYSLNNVVSYRSASQSINFQNQPIRDPILGELVRRAFIARFGRQLVELDFSGAEVRVGSSYHQDPVMVNYILDKSTDMHRDMAAELFITSTDNVAKTMRQEAKGNFVFAEFYGAWYPTCAERIWKFVKDESHVTKEGVSVIQHLASKGINALGACDPDQRPRPGTFEHHVQKVEKHLWGDRFKVYDQWKRDYFEEYKQNGWILTKTGFVCQGYMNKKEVCNYPIQSASFHMLLWALIRIVRVELARRNMLSLIVGQIHDSIVADVVPSELDDFIRMCRKVMTKLVARQYPWLVVPMEVEASVCPVGGSWIDKEEYAFA